ncbi:MAG: hypothetical protein Q7U04_08095, partial [Bacteriovorax sp.]|nr:hypothetical protein [Bacteriovorax sp.]
SEVDMMNKRYPSAHITLWDFSGYGEMQCELIPGRNNKQAATQWYWEAGHFKQEYGSRILASLLSSKKNQIAENPDIRLNVSNLNKNRQRIQKERTSCLSTYPELFGQVDRLWQLRSNYQ